MGQGGEARADKYGDEVWAFEPALRRYFRRRASPDEIDDLIQEVFLGLQSRRAEAPIEDLGRYLFGIAGHALAHRRSRARLHQAFGPEHETDGELSPERALISRQQLDRAVEVIAALPPRTRQVFLLHRFEERTYRRIANELGISVSAVEKHIMTALRALIGAGLR